jgi:hypothetical protein
MEEWWKRNDIDLAESEKNRVEDYTGCIPLLLNECKDGNKINLYVASTKAVWSKASKFVWKMHMMDNPYIWRRYNILL